MRPLSTRRRLATTALAGVALGASLLAAPIGSATAEPDAAEAFRPSLVEVSTPDRESRQLVAESGLDVTEHYGHDDVQVVIHSPADQAILEALEEQDKYVRSTPVIADLVQRQAEINAANRGLRREHRPLAAAVGPDLVPHAGRLQHRHVEAGQVAPRHRQALRAAAEEHRAAHDLRHRDRQRRAPRAVGPARPSC